MQKSILPIPWLRQLLHQLPLSITTSTTTTTTTTSLLAFYSSTPLATHIPYLITPLKGLPHTALGAAPEGWPSPSFCLKIRSGCAVGKEV